MKFLFVHQNFPGQYLHIIRHLIRAPGHEVAFITEPNKNNIPGIRRVNYHVKEYRADAVHPNIRDLNLAMMRADAVGRMGASLKQLGFAPDLIIGHHGWGELLNLTDVFPSTPMLGYFEFYYEPEGSDVGFDPEFPSAPDQFPRVRAMNAVNHLALALNHHGQTPTEWQRSLYPGWAQQQIALLPEGVQLDVCKPDPGAHSQPLVVNDFTINPEDKLVTYVARNLEPYRGFHTMMRALPALLQARPDVKVVMLGGDEVSYGARIANMTWREFMSREIAGKYDASRVLMPGQVPYETHVRLLQRSDAHVYLTYPFVLSWSLREAMACGCAIVGADVAPVREFIEDGKSGVLTDCLDPGKLATRVVELLEDSKLAAKIRKGARAYAEKHLDMGTYLARYEALIEKITGEDPRLSTKVLATPKPSPPASPESRRRPAAAKAAR
ncbi:MAG: glycosyltransferase family 4 protein [Alphaproteobacteria bacterium]|nr:glycosyltransferase family 4 protein [Alphaproteobacteria bacterium]